MRIIKLDAIDSTNTYLRDLSSANLLEDYTVVSANKQTKGRGQMGAVWSSEESSNLTFSMLRVVSFLESDNQYYLNIVAALALTKLLSRYNIPKISIKWPNDILSVDKKICGILIENVIKQNKLSSSIIGIGLNVNQTKFINLPKASSLKLINGNHFNLDELLFELIKDFKFYFSILEKGGFLVLKSEYESLLFKKNKPSTFKNGEGELFSGFINGVTENGCLEVMLEDNKMQSFNLKEIELLY